MATSQNGFAANNRALIHSPVVPGLTVKFPGGIRKGAVTTVLLYVAVQWQRRVEPITPGHCWGYAERAIRGSTTTSNHASGTATDTNAPKHPLAVKGTFTAQQRATLRAIEREVEGVVRFGEFYSGRVDGMHVEINASLAKVEQVAARLVVGGAAPTPQTVPVVNGRRTLKLTTPHMQGDDVREFQRVADAWFKTVRPDWFPLANRDGSYDGIFGPRCDKAARWIQGRPGTGLVVDGEVGPATRKLLGIK